MFNLSDILNTLDNAAKESLEEEKVSATYIRSQRKGDSSVDIAKTPFSVGHGAPHTSALAVSEDVGTPHLSTYKTAQLVSDNVGLSSSDGLVDKVQETTTTSHAMNNGDSRETREVLKGESSESTDTKTGGVSTEASTAKPAVDVHKPTLSISLPEDSIATSLPAPIPTNTKNVSALESEIERLNSECLELEDQVTSLKREGEEAWSSYQRAQSTASNRESELLEEINTLKKSKTDLSNSNAQLQSKANTDFEDILSQLKQVQGEKEETFNKMKSMTAEMEGREKVWKENEESLLTELSVAKTTGVQGSEDLKIELRNALDAANTLRMEHKSLVHQAHQRETGLEESNAELSILVANLQREIANAKSSASNDNDHIDPILGAGSGGQMAEDRQLDVLYASIQAKSEEMSRCKESLSTLEHTVNALRKENNSNEERRREEVENMQGQMNRYKSTITTLEGQLKDAKKANAYSSTSGGGGRLMQPFGGDDTDNNEDGEEDVATLRQSNKQLREQAQSVSKQLLRKQQMVLELQAERSTLKSRLQDTTSDLEMKTRELRENGGGAYSPYGFGDEEEGGFYPPSSNQSTGLIKRGGGTSDNSPGTASKSQQGKMVRELERYGMKAPMPVAKAVDAIDSWTLVTGRYMKAYPLIRIGVVFYLVFLHIWVFFVLSLHASSMDGAPHQAEIGDFVTNNIQKRPHISGGGLGPG